MANNNKLKILIKRIRAIFVCMIKLIIKKMNANINKNSIFITNY